MKTSPVLLCFLCCVVEVFSQTFNIDRCPTHLARDRYLRTFRDRCYQFETYQLRNWHVAEEDCQHHGGHLIAIEDAQTQHFVDGVLNDLHWHHAGLWIGLNDIHKEGHYVWSTGQVCRFFHWGPHEPTFLLHIFEDCVVIDRDDHYKWEDHICSGKNGYACQFDMLPKQIITTTVKTTTVRETPSTSVPTTTATPSTSVPTTTATQTPSTSVPTTATTTQTPSTSVPTTATTTQTPSTSVPTTTTTQTPSTSVPTTTTTQTPSTSMPTTTITVSDTTMSTTTTATTTPLETTTTNVPTTSTPAPTTTIKVTTQTEVPTTVTTTPEQIPVTDDNPCTDFECDLDCSETGFQIDDNGCPVCLCAE